jgi:hypothetical protein
MAVRPEYALEDDAQQSCQAVVVSVCERVARACVA